MTCPLCDGRMVRRANASTGQRFWGCARYPACTGTRDVQGEARQPALREVLDRDGGDELPSERQYARDRSRWRDG
ncbi:MAG: topoisomerase DNA-binding C4 zinc finger domain-containing protein [Vicinamibacterales bacterium]|nr:topoisomerase DNA-binding C4 zinc finger domain-containing protein [Vicinamibacterales bacterium]